MGGRWWRSSFLSILSACSCRWNCRNIIVFIVKRIRTCHTCSRNSKKEEKICRKTVEYEKWCQSYPDDIPLPFLADAFCASKSLFSWALLALPWMVFLYKFRWKNGSLIGVEVFTSCMELLWNVFLCITSPSPTLTVFR